MTNAHQPRTDRMYGFIVTGTYTAERRVTSAEMSSAVAKSLALSFAEPDAIASFILPRMKSPLAYDVRSVWTSLTPFDRNHIREISPELFNAITLLLKAVPDNEADASNGSNGVDASSTGTQVASEAIRP